MPKIVSVSRRTDIPAFYADWFMNRVRAGFALVRNPFNARQVSTVALTPAEVACLVFWTRDPRPLLPYLDELDARGLRYYFQVTLTGLPRAWEPAAPTATEIVPALHALARHIGPERVLWRFDPLVLAADLPVMRTAAVFAALAAELEGAVGRVTVSFLRGYRQVRGRLRALPGGWRDWDALPEAEWTDTARPLVESLAAGAAARGMELGVCAEPRDLTAWGLPPAACIDAGLIGRLFGIELPAVKDRNQRMECRCAPSIDIGAYGSCRHGCRYCYAGGDAALVRGERHHPDQPLLLGALPDPSGLAPNIDDL
jgi:hypothetical protein